MSKTIVQKSIVTSFFDREVKRISFTGHQNKQMANTKGKVVGKTTDSNKGNAITSGLSALPDSLKASGKKDTSPENTEMDNLEKQYMAMEKVML